ncbi:hypothetical protein ACIBQX_28380 [Nonomuraea sp. NPDC049714]|uniref:hypothetical protein n=1 Tax=Nonomuraea sp. NPDC049714 TaxID=3364357 RepID=UPI00378B197C
MGGGELIGLRRASTRNGFRYDDSLARSGLIRRPQTLALGGVEPAYLLPQVKFRERLVVDGTANVRSQVRAPDMRTRSFTTWWISYRPTRRMAEFVRTYEDARLDPADVSVVAIAERLAITHIATLDRRDFLLMRPRQVPAFRLLPETLL